MTLLMNELAEFVDPEPGDPYDGLRALAPTMRADNGQLVVECATCGAEFRTRDARRRYCCAACAVKGKRKGKR